VLRGRCATLGPSAVLHRPEIHSVDHRGSTGFMGSDFRGDLLNAAPARSVKAYSGQCRSDPDDENDCIDPDYAQEGGREQQSTYTNHDLRDDHALPALLGGIGQGIDLSFEIGDLLVEVVHAGGSKSVCATIQPNLKRVSPVQTKLPDKGPANRFSDSSSSVLAPFYFVRVEHLW
jgi:hypothetical protein